MKKIVSGGKQEPGTGVGAGSKPVHTGQFANGDIACKGWGDRIDRSVCIVRGIRYPQKCAGAACALNL